MTTVRFYLPFILLVLALLCPAPALAGWWFGEDSSGEKSGLDLQGYDQNTVISLRGKVVSIDSQNGKGPALAVIRTETETISLVLGPREFWREQGIPLHPGDEVNVRGSKALGQDGVVYLMVQSISKPESHQESTLRTRTGRPVWSGGNRLPHQGMTPVRIRSGRNH